MFFLSKVKKTTFQLQTKKEELFQLASWQNRLALPLEMDYPVCTDNICRICFNKSRNCFLFLFFFLGLIFHTYCTTAKKKLCF